MGYLFWAIVIIWVIRKLVKAGQQEEAAKALQQQAHAAIERGLTVRCVDDVLRPEDGSEPIPIKRLSVSGTIGVPRTPQPVRFVVHLADVTDSEDEPELVFCLVPDLADEDGIFEYEREATIPNQLFTIKDLPLTIFPLFALAGPRRGQRKVEVLVGVVDEDDDSDLFSAGSTTFTYHQEVIGYREMGERRHAREKQMATLALAISASDGQIDKREVAIIRSFFAKRYADRKDADDRRKKITEVLQETLERLTVESAVPSEMIRGLCDEIREDGDEDVAQTAYELCVQVVAADGNVDKREQQELESIAARLSLPSKFVQEVHDRHLRLAMFEEADEERLLGMPEGLSVEEKLEFLNGEYRKWRARATHKDQAVAAEATLRLERITKLRRQLTDATAA